MKCPKCGSSSKAAYVVKRRKVGGKRLTEPRKDFRAECQKCGYEWSAEPIFGELEIEKEPVKILGPLPKKKVEYYIFCRLKSQQFIKDASCPKFKPIDPSGKKRCYNCKHGE